MHDVDRTQAEYGEVPELASEQQEFPGEFESSGETLGEAFEAALHEQQEGAFETAAEVQESPLGEAQEMELAAELLEVSSEEELDRFLGKLIRRAGQAAGRFVRSPVGRALGGALKSVARTALPMAGRALGTFVGGPVGGMIGGQLASAAGRAFGLELEGLSAEDREFEVARRFVRFGGAAARRAAMTPPSVPPQTAARTAITVAARRHAPGLLRTGIGGAGVAGVAGPATATTVAGPAGYGYQRRGIWMRRGRKIVLLGV